MHQHITKTRYAKLVELIKSIVPDDESKCEQIMSGIRNIFDFDTLSNPVRNCKNKVSHRERNCLTKKEGFNSTKRINMSTDACTF